MLRLSPRRRYAVRLERNGPVPTWSRTNLTADQVRDLVRQVAVPVRGALLRNDYLVVSDDRGAEQFIWF